MCCRARRLLGQEYREHRAARLFGIFARPVSDNFLEWLAEIQGLKDSLWEGAVLQLSLTYSEKYNDVPPTVKFNTIPFHPNVDQYSGRPCIDFLDNPEEWKEKLTISNILLAIQVMLSNPVTENAVNVEAAEMLKNNMPLYRQMVMQCVRNSLHPEELSHIEKDRVSPLTFYQRAEGSSLGSARCTAIISQLIRKQRKQTAGELSEMSKIENYQFWQSPDVPDLPSERQRVDEDGHDNREELWEKEVDNLVAWTNTLSNKRLED
ncbi:ubiquitin-conjugating enzyme E2 U isoform X3 [Struthio camelus]|uniref:ubiquitin-conjugating enzyme E2 U isoform X3 n=1 Tax=Struthio camelus TaxID=8801 RepID=UPI0036040664